MRDLRRYITEEIPVIIERVALVSSRLADLAEEIAEVEQMEHREKTEGYVSVQGPVTDKRNLANYQAMHVTTEIIKLKGERAALEEEKSFLLSLISWRVQMRSALTEVG